METEGYHRKCFFAFIQTYLINNSLRYTFPFRRTTFFAYRMPVQDRSHNPFHIHKTNTKNQP